MDDVLDTMVQKEPLVTEVNVHTNALALAGFVNLSLLQWKNMN